MFNQKGRYLSFLSGGGGVNWNPIFHLPRLPIAIMKFHYTENDVIPAGVGCNQT